MSHMPIFEPNFTRDIWDLFDERFYCPCSFHAPHFPTSESNLTPFDCNFFHGSNPPMLNQIHDRMALKWEENPEAYTLRVELPEGLKKEEVEMKLEGSIFKIRGKKQARTEEKNENWQHFEQSEAEFMNAISLPENRRDDDIKPSFENGVLTVTVPKRMQ